MTKDPLFPEFAAARRIGAILTKLPFRQQASVVQWINGRFPNHFTVRADAATAGAVAPGQTVVMGNLAQCANE